MAKQYNMQEAKTNFSKLAQMAEAGEEVVIARNGVPLMKMVLIEEKVRPPRDFSKLKGLIQITTDQTWEEIDEEILANLRYSDREA